MNDIEAEELYDKWNEWAVYLSNYAVVNLNEKAERIYKEFKSIKEKLCSQETTKHLKFLKDNWNKMSLKADLYHLLLDDESEYVDCLSFMNSWPPIDKVEFLEFYIEQYIDYDNVNTALSKAVRANLNQTKQLHGII